MITNQDDLKLGECVCVIRNKFTGKERLVKGSVDRVPYKKNASADSRKKYGKNLVYVIYYSNEEVVGFYQD